jgi:O-phosphoseryl-tRNA(Cys) synthetase
MDLDADPTVAAKKAKASKANGASDDLSKPASEFLQGEAYTLLQTIFKYRNALVRLGFRPSLSIGPVYLVELMFVSFAGG